MIAGTVLPASHQPNSEPTPERMISGPPMSPSIAIHRGTNPELYIR